METLDRTDVLRSGKSDPPSGNRVWDFFAFSFSRTRSIWSKSPEPHRENRPTSTTIASGRTEGNVSEYIDSGGTDVAHYEYDPYGNVIASTGAKVNDFTYRFSTKYEDSETGLYYYGYRFYKPGMGRWLNRDPIGEDGGNNLHAFLGNSSVGRIDRLGLLGIKTTTNPHDTFTECGTVSMANRWTGLPSGSYGWVVQKLRFLLTTWDCDGNVLKNRKELFWEAFPVRRGVGASDGWRTSNPKKTVGHLEITGEAGFYNGTAPPTYPPGFKLPWTFPGNPKPPIAKGPYKKPPAPKFWPLSGMVKRFMSYTWDCCCPCKGSILTTSGGDVGSRISKKDSTCPL